MILAEWSLPVIASHFTPDVVRKKRCYLILCDYNTTPILPFHIHRSMITSTVHQFHRVHKSTMSPTSTASNMSTTPTALALCTGRRMNDISFEYNDLWMDAASD